MSSQRNTARISPRTPAPAPGPPPRRGSAGAAHPLGARGGTAPAAAPRVANEQGGRGRAGRAIRAAAAGQAAVPERGCRALAAFPVSAKDRVARPCAVSDEAAVAASRRPRAARSCLSPRPSGGMGLGASLRRGGGRWVGTRCPRTKRAVPGAGCLFCRGTG